MTSTDISTLSLLCQQNIISRADGSAQFSEGNEVIVAGVLGPVSAKIRKELADRSYIDVLYYPKVGKPGVAEQTLKDFVQKSCEDCVLVTQHPRTAIIITLQELQSNTGQILSTCVNTSCLALMDSGVPMKYLIAAVTCVVTDGVIKVHPDKTQIKESDVIATFVFESEKRQLQSLHVEGLLSEDELLQCITICQEATENIFQYYRDSVKKI